MTCLDTQSLVTVATLARPPVCVRPLAFPSEHGGWDLLLEPVVLALVVAPSFAGLLIGAGAVATFLARHPLKLAVQDGLRGQRYPRTMTCVLLGCAYGSVAFLAFTFAGRQAGALPLVALCCALPFAATQFTHDARNRGRSVVAELCGAAAPSAVAAAIALAASSPLAIPLVVLTCARSLPAVLYVRFALRGESRVIMLTSHAAAIAAAILCAPLTAVAAMGLLFARAMTPGHAAARTIGLREVGWGVVTVALIAVGYRW